jgi:hypothetical protein
MKTEKAIQVLRDYNLWRKGNDEMEQPDPHTVGEAIDDVLMAIDNMEEEAKLHRGAITGWQNKWECAVGMAAKAEAERDLWRAEAQRWRHQALDLEAQIETAIKRIQWRQDNLDRGIKELKSGY